MPYFTLGSRFATGALDTTGNNPGNWTVTFDPAAINVNVPQFEIWHIIVKGASSKATFNVFINSNQFSINVYGVANEWDPQTPLVARPGVYIYFYYTTPATDGFQPTITIWLRYDLALTSGLYQIPAEH